MVIDGVLERAERGRGRVQTRGGLFQLGMVEGWVGVGGGGMGQCLPSVYCAQVK